MAAASPFHHTPSGRPSANPKGSSKVDPTCPICLEIMVDPVVAPCGHAFDKDCVTAALLASPRCPCCRQDLTPWSEGERGLCIVLKSFIRECFPAEIKAREMKHSRDQHLIAVAGGSGWSDTNHGREQVRQLLADGACIHASTDDGTTALHVAQAAEVVEVLLEAGGSRSTVDSLGRTPLHRAVNGSVVRALLKGLDAAALKVLLENRRSTEEDTSPGPLECAMTDGRLDATRALLEAGALRQSLGQPVLRCAIRRATETGDWECLRALLRRMTSNPQEAGDADDVVVVDVSSTGDMESVEILLTGGCVVDLESRKRRALPLGMAARHGHHEVVKMLLEWGAEVNALSGHGSALHEVARASAMLPAPVVMRVVDVLLQAGAHVEGAGESSEEHNLDTPLMLLCRARHREDISGDLLAAPRLLLQVVFKDVVQRSGGVRGCGSALGWCSRVWSSARVVFEGV
eukprot:gene20090-24049_t